MSNYGREKPFYERLATSFNALLGIPAGYFGATPKTKVKGAGVLRAEARLLAHRRAQVERLGDNYGRVTMTRQIRRQMERKAAKQERQAIAAELRKMSFNQRRDRGLITGGIA